MTGLYTFRCSTPQQPLPMSNLVIFCGPDELLEGDVETAVSDAMRIGPPPEAVLLLAPQDQLPAVAALQPGHSAWDPLLDGGREVRLAAYDRAGQFHPNGWTQSSAELTALMCAVRRQGLTALFRKRGGLLESGPSAHFVKPSERLDSRFLRAAHALSEGGEIFFTALWLLPYLGDDVRVVHVDTSSIASVVFAAQLLKGAATDPSLPTLRTFRSYDGIDDHPFSRDRRELALISASQSGTMAEKLRAKLSHPSDVITLFSLGNTSEGTTILCDLCLCNKNNPLGFQKNIAKPSGIATRAIRIIGEHFIAESKPARTILPVAVNPPPILGRLGAIAGKEIFSVLRASGSEGEKAPWVNVAPLLLSDDGKKWLRGDVMGALPVTTRALVRVDNSVDTESLVESLVHEIHEQSGASPLWREISLSDIETGKVVRDWPIEQSSIVVVAGAVGHGRELLSVSRALRDFAPESRRIFITAAVVGAQEEINRVLASNLQYGGHRLVRMIDLAIDRRQSIESWELERRELQKFEGELPSELTDRLTALCSTSRGLVNNLFIKDGDPLKLRRTFAFWPNFGGSCSQADVFVTVSALLENLRSAAGTPPDIKLVNDAQTQSVLSPETFTRFNDGVIQSAFLRAARPVELNYSSSPEQSRTMADLILRMADLHDRPHGEALCEFLLALRLGRLLLDEQRTSSVAEGVRTRAASLPPIARWLATATP